MDITNYLSSRGTMFSQGAKKHKGRQKLSLKMNGRTISFWLIWLRRKKGCSSLPWSYFRKGASEALNTVFLIRILKAEANNFPRISWTGTTLKATVKKRQVSSRVRSFTQQKEGLMFDCFVHTLDYSHSEAQPSHWGSETLHSITFWRSNQYKDLAGMFDEGSRKIQNYMFLRMFLESK